MSVKLISNDFKVWSFSKQELNLNDETYNGSKSPSDFVEYHSLI